MPKRESHNPKTSHIEITNIGLWLSSKLPTNKLRFHRATFCQEPKFDSGEQASCVERMHIYDNY